MIMPISPRINILPHPERSFLVTSPKSVMLPKVAAHTRKVEVMDPVVYARNITDSVARLLMNIKRREPSVRYKIVC